MWWLFVPYGTFMCRFIFALVAIDLKNSSTSSTGNVADRRAGEVHVEDERRPAGEVDRDLGQGLVHRHDRPAVAVDAALVAECLLDRLAEDDADVFDGVVRIDLQIALGVDVEVDQAVPREQVEHVIEEPDAGLDAARAGAVEIERQLGSWSLWSGGRFRRCDWGVDLDIAGCELCGGRGFTPY